MDTKSVGNLNLCWSQGYNGTKAEYIDGSVICYVCGSNIKFISDDGTENIFAFHGESISAIAVHPVEKVFAVAESGLSPSIFIYSYPDFNVISTLKDAGQLELSNLSFSMGCYVASISGLPDFQLILWDYMTGQKLASAFIGHMTPSSFGFNPANWRQICVTTEKEISIWQTEQSDEVYMLQETKVQCPPTDPHDVPDEQAITTSLLNKQSQFSIDLPKTAIAGVIGSMAEGLDAIQDSTDRVIPLSQAWSPTGDVYIGCQGGQLLKVDGLSWITEVVYNPESAPSRAVSRVNSATSQHATDGVNMLFGGSLDCLALHKKGLYAGGEDGVLRLIDIESANIKIVERCNVGVPMTSISFTASYLRLVLGSSKGDLYLYEPGNTDSLRNLTSLHVGQFVALDVLAPGTETCVTLREDGEVQLWNIETGICEGSMNIGFQCTCLASCPVSHVVIVGAMSGHVYIIDCTEPTNLRIIQRTRLYHGPVLHLVYEQMGRFVVAAGDSPHIFFIKGKPSKGFGMLGYTDVSGDVHSLSTCTNPTTRNVQVVITTNDGTVDRKRGGATHLMQVDFTYEQLKDIKKCYASLKCNFRTESLNKIELSFASPCYGVRVSVGRHIYGLGQSNKKIQKFVIPDKPPSKRDVEGKILTPLEEFPCHELPGGSLTMSPHHEWVASCGHDGRLHIRITDDMSRSVCVIPHDYHHGGVKMAVFSDDCSSVITAGYQGVVSCHKWKFSEQGAGKANSAVESSRARKSALLKSLHSENERVKAQPVWQFVAPVSRPASATEKEDKALSEKEAALQNNEIYMTPTPEPPDDATWLEVKQLEVHKEEDRKYTDMKTNLRKEIQEMRNIIQNMITTNEDQPDIEKLSRQEFDLDIEEQARLQADGETEIMKIREEIDFENLAKRYLREVIKKECWDEMKVKGRSIQAFNSYLEVANFPMKTRSDTSLALLDTVSKRREVQKLDMEVRKELEEIKIRAADIDDENGDEDDNGTEKPSTTGSLGAQFGGDNELLASQFQLHGRQEKISQIVLLEDAIFRIKQTFNKEFDESFSRKEQEISKIKEKNRRIVKILTDLDLQEEIFEPQLGTLERPENLLTVKDEEVKVERFLTNEQAKKVDEQKKVEEETRQREMGDNWRGRGLDLMMGGVLEIKKEDELKKDVPMPAFMSDKPTDDWSEEELKISKEYEKKVKDLAEEREKYRKQLETELRKLQALIQEGMVTFDESLNSLFMRKVQTQMVLYQEELKILRLRSSLLMEEELKAREIELSHLLEKKREQKQQSAHALTEARKRVDTYREQYDTLVAEDRLMERQFKREFADCTALQIDQLFRLFKKRPRGQKFRAETPGFDPGSQNPFNDRPSTALRDAQSQTNIEAFVAEMDCHSNMPEGVEHECWFQLCTYRKKKIASEQQVKDKANIMADMMSFISKRQEEDDRLKNDIDDIIQQTNSLNEDQVRFFSDLEVQLLLKQGQVEIDASNFIHDFTDSVLIHRTVVEDLNATIKQLGEGKITSMVESKDFRKGIIQLEWEHKRMMMQLTDLQNKMKDIQFMKVTREIQLFLNESNYDAKKSQEVGILEQTIQLQEKKLEKKIHEKEKIMRDLENTIKQKGADNGELDRELEELNVSLNERKHIDEVNADKRTDSNKDKRYKEIVQRRKLVDLAKAQAQEVAVLRAEVERLRMRTFPALVQVSNNT